MYISNHGANIEYFAKKFNKKANEIIDFSSNINIFSPDIDYKAVFKHIKNNIGRYPDINYNKLKESVSSIYNVNSYYIYVANGATEVLYDILSLDIFKNVGIFHPTFSEYERACNYFKKNAIELDINLFDNIDKIHFKTIKDNIFKNCELPDILIICNPNNPTGKIYKLEALLDFCKNNNIFLLVDETFIDFCYNDKYSLKRYISSYDNLIIINAITKFFAMTGARLGYSFCSSFEFNKLLNQIKKPWSVNILAESIAFELSKIDREFYDFTKKYYTSEIERLYNKYIFLNNLDISLTNTCFFCIKFYNISVKKLQMDLLENKNMLVRVLDNYKNMDNNSIRIAIKDIENNDKIFLYIKKYLEDNINY